MASQERAKRSPVPRDPKTWAREVDGIEGFLARLSEWEKVYGPSWGERMGEYYRSRLELLRANPPKVKGKGSKRGQSDRRRSRR